MGHHNNWKGIASAIEAAQAKHESRLNWMRALEVGDVVVLHEEDARGKVPPTKVRVTKTSKGVRSLEVEGHPRRNLWGPVLGKWERGGRNWLRLHIEPEECDK